MSFLKELRVKNVQRCEESFYKLHEWSLTDWATALAGETGELCNLIKKIRRGEKILQKDLANELADIIIYADLLAARLEIDLEDCISKKFNEVSDRVGSTLKIYG